jgi:hypothetical protein
MNTPTPRAPSGYEAQEARKAADAARFRDAAQDLADWIAECAPETASDFEGSVEQWIADHGVTLTRWS